MMMMVMVILCLQPKPGIFGGHGLDSSPLGPWAPRTAQRVWGQTISKLGLLHPIPTSVQVHKMYSEMGQSLEMLGTVQTEGLIPF